MRHGGEMSEAICRYGGLRNEWLDLSTGINPHAWPQPGRVSSEAWTQLPGAGAMSALLAAARSAYGVPAHLGLTAAPGTETILRRLPALHPHGDVAILAPTYSGHAEGWRRSVADADRAVREIETLGELTPADRIVVVVNPNNPDGRILPPQDLLGAARALAVHGGLLVVDEAFADVAPEASILPYLGDEPVAVLRSFGKFFGLAGLRLGFLAASPALCDRLSEELGGWAVSGPALEIGAAALADLGWQESMRQRLTREADALDSMLRRQGLEIVGGTSLFRLVCHPQAHGLHAALARRHIWTRCFDYAPDWLRIGLPGADPDRARLAGALGEALAEATRAHDRTGEPC